MDLLTSERKLKKAQRLTRARENSIATKDSIVVAVARVGHEDQAIVAGRMEDVVRDGDAKLGGPLHSLVVVGSTDHIERGMLGLWWIGDRAALEALSEEKAEAAAAGGAGAVAAAAAVATSAAAAAAAASATASAKAAATEGDGEKEADKAADAIRTSTAAAASRLGELEEAVGAVEAATSRAGAAVDKAGAIAAAAAAAIREKEQRGEVDTAADGLEFANADPLFGDASSDESDAEED